MDRGAWWETVHGVTEFDTTEQLCMEHEFTDLSISETVVGECRNEKRGEGPKRVYYQISYYSEHLEIRSMGCVLVSG